MKEYPQLRQAIEQSVKRTAEDSTMLFGVELGHDIVDTMAFERDVYLSAVEDTLMVSAVSIKGDCEGVFYIIQTIRDAIVMSSTLLGIPEARIKEKKNLGIYSTDDEDAFNEIINQFSGSFNTVFEKAVDLKTHLKSVGVARFNPETDTKDELLPIPEGKYLIVRALLTIPGIDTDRFDILIPVELATAIDPTFEEEAASEASAGEAGADADGVSKPVSGVQVLLIAFNEVEAQRVAELIQLTGATVVKAGPSTNVSELLFEHTVSSCIVVSDYPGGDEFSMCVKVSTSAHGAPILMTGQDWTRTRVMKAIKCGVKSVLVSPWEDIQFNAKLAGVMEQASE